MHTTADTTADTAADTAAATNADPALTDDVEGYDVADFRLSADLTLVEAGVARLHVFNLQRPRLRVVHVEALEALVRDERVPVHGEDVRIAVTDPRHLEGEEGGRSVEAKMSYS